MPLADRIVEVIADLGGAGHARYRYGSGCLVAGQIVLTAAHVVVGAKSVKVRGPDKVAHTAAVDPKFVGDVDGPRPDLALLELSIDEAEMPAMPLAAVDRDSVEAEPLERCQAVGYPWFAERPSPTIVRETYQIYGYVLVLSHLVSGLLTLQVSSSPRDLPPAEEALANSQWSGMSGAPVIAQGRLLGVVSEHAPREGPSSITFTPLTALERDPAHPRWGSGVPDPAAWWTKLGVHHGGAASLERLPHQRGRPFPAYRATLREIHRRTGQLNGREDELAAIADFARGPAGYRWLIGDAWAGKTALLAEAVMSAMPAQVDVAAYFLSRREADADSSRFIAAVVPQLAYLLNEETPIPELDQFRSLWDRAVDRAATSSRHLLLAVDGLDEDLHPRPLPTVAMLLPVHIGTHAHVLVTSRTNFLPDMPVGHPLGVTRPVVLDPFPGGKHLASLARKEFDDLLRGEDQDLAAEILGVLTAAAGPLTIDDLATLTADLASVTPAWARKVDRVVTEEAARSLQPVGDRYQFAHGELLEQAQTAKSLRVLRHPHYRQRIHRWADSWRGARWPLPEGDDRGSPRYLLDEYPFTLADQPKRFAALLNDGRWLTAVERAVGVDRLVAALVTGQAIGISIDELVLHSQFRW
jgi:hypothetical protein